MKFITNIVLFYLFLITSISAQSFGAQQKLTTQADGASSVYATDLDGDGDADVLSASENDDKIAWYENQGGGTFGPQQVITTSADAANSVYATDLDGDGDADVLSTSFGQSASTSNLAWYENRVNEPSADFGPQQIIANVDGAQSVYATDLDGDGDADVLCAAYFEDKIAWYENTGGGTFGPQQVITTNTNGPNSVYATDLDGDGDADVLSASNWDDKIAWYENVGAGNGVNGGSFGSEQIITTNAGGASSVYATDLDGDGDADVLSASQNDDKIAWYENLGGGTFGTQQVITTNLDAASYVYATDLDGDGDADVLSAAILDDKIAWYENQGGGTFGTQQVITTNADYARSVYATDLDGDGDSDVLSASFSDDKIAWYENGFSIELFETPTFDLNIDWGRGQPAAQYFAFYSMDPLNGSSPGTGGLFGLHLSLSEAWAQLGSGLAGDPFFGGILDANGSATVTYNQPGLASLSGYTVWAIALQVNPSPTSGYEASSMKKLTFL